VIHVSQQSELWRRIDNWCLEVIGIRESNRNADAIPFMEPVRDWQQAEGQFNRFPGRDWH
jgi:hypothetical protein